MVEELYQNIGGDYQKAISRMQDDERIKKYLRFFLADESYKQLEDAIEADKTFNMLMGDDVGPRRDFIIDNAKFVKNLDI